MTDGPDPEDPAEAGVEDELQDLIGSVAGRSEDDEEPGDEFAHTCGGKLPPDHPDADVFDDLDL